MKVIITGGTGFIGRALVASLAESGDEVVVLSRSRQRTMPKGARIAVWPGADSAGAKDCGSVWREALDGADAVVHLAGEPVAARRWSADQKERIRGSRIAGTRTLVDALSRLERKPQVLVSGSAVGYYGPRGNEEIDESTGPGQDFLSGVCEAWEREALQARSLGMRVVLLRTGTVLGNGGGALPRMLPPFRFGLGGPIGSGRQWMSWIHLADAIGLIRFLIQTEKADGPFNAVAPSPVTNRDFSRTIGEVLRKPSRIPVPAAMLRLVFGEMADAMLLSGQRVIPARALALGYGFAYGELEPALKEILV